MRAYFYDNVPLTATEQGDQRLPHDSGRTVSADHLASLGVVYQRIQSFPADVDKLAAARGYRNRDEIEVSPRGLGAAYDEKVKMFFKEHLHEDEEIRFVQDGTGYFDVRGKDDEWIRVAVEKNDLLILPAGIYHRFTTAEDDYLRAMRLFQDQPKWTPLDRCHKVDENPFRKDYVEQHLVK